MPCNMKEPSYSELLVTVARLAMMKWQEKKGVRCIDCGHFVLKPATGNFTSLAAGNTIRPPESSCDRTGEFSLAALQNGFIKSQDFGLNWAL